MRKAELSRTTNETNIKTEVNLDGKGTANINTGIGFFDHMLTQISVHGLFDISIEAEGDLHIDPHHTIEDCGLAFGETVNQALGDRRGITRMASAYVPMDESLGHAVLDLSGRPYSVITIPWAGSTVGNIPTSLIEHFFESFAITCRCNLHTRILYGKDNHHMSEALFKAFGRALDTATQMDDRRLDQIPSSKGSLI
jgi:imidazoleglycerol-phosphate dehydratase